MPLRGSERTENAIFNSDTYLEIPELFFRFEGIFFGRSAPLRATRPRDGRKFSGIENLASGLLFPLGNRAVQLGNRFDLMRLGRLRPETESIPSD